MADGFGPTAERIAATSAGARRSAALAKDDREARDLTLYEADAAGWPLREIARLSGLSVGYVSRIVVRETARRQAAALAAVRDPL